VLYASGVLGDPDRRASYDQLARERSTLMRTIIIGDFFHTPVAVDLLVEPGC
jgi:hypothetical protein